MKSIAEVSAEEKARVPGIRDHFECLQSDGNGEFTYSEEISEEKMGEKM